jgi:hypothetical protein
MRILLKKNNYHRCNYSGQGIKKAAPFYTVAALVERTGEMSNFSVEELRVFERLLH